MKYTLYRGFLKIDTYDSISEAKKKAPKKDGIYNLISEDKSYRDSWLMLKGEIIRSD